MHESHFPRSSSGEQAPKEAWCEARGLVVQRGQGRRGGNCGRKSLRSFCSAEPCLAARSIQTVEPRCLNSTAYSVDSWSTSANAPRQTWVSVTPAFEDVGRTKGTHVAADCGVSRILRTACPSTLLQYSVLYYVAACRLGLGFAA